MMFYSSFQGEKGVMCKGEGGDVWGDWGWHLRGGVKYEGWIVLEWSKDDKFGKLIGKWHKQTDRQRINVDPRSS